MKAQKFVLSAIALVVAVGGVLAVKAKQNATLQLFTKATAACHSISMWTTASGTAAPNNVYTTVACHHLYSGHVTTNHD